MDYLTNDHITYQLFVSFTAVHKIWKKSVKEHVLTFELSC